MTKTAILATLIAATAAVPLYAQSRDGGRERPTFEALDADGNGAITAEEIQAQLDERFNEADADGDGSISREEFIARAQTGAAERAERMFDRLDADGDGTLSRDVLAARQRRGPSPERMIERLDTDGDGAVSEEEFQAGMERRAERGGRGERGKRHN